MLLGIASKASGEADKADLTPVDVEPQTTAEDMMSEYSGETNDFTELNQDQPQKQRGGGLGGPTQTWPVEPAAPESDLKPKPLKTNKVPQELPKRPAS